MLSQLSIDNYAIAEHLDIELHPGMTVVTGETGAGKSIMLDALGLAIGDRADAGIVRHGADKTEIHACFDISAIAAAQRWLSDNDRLLDEQQCMLRRVISKEGRSRAWINGQPATLAELKALGSLLVDIHSQHAHQSLLKKDSHRRILDAFAGADQLATEVRDLAAQYQQKSAELQRKQSAADEGSAQAQLLRYQLDELEQLALGEGELEQLEQEQKQLANAEQMLANSHKALGICREEENNLEQLLQRCLNAVQDTPVKTSALEAAESLLDSALIQVQEAGSELQQHIDSVEMNPERLAEVEARLDSIYTVARKHKIQAEQLSVLQQSLNEELMALVGNDEDISQLQQDCEQLQSEWHNHSSKLSSERSKAAKKLQKAVEAQLSALSMANCRFEVALPPRSNSDSREGEPSIHPHGAEEPEFLISTNPGSPAAALNKIASGGELSRISLTIQVITARVMAVPTVVFDEVDVGIGGATAEVVGELLHQLGQQSQVLCVTHQAQVACKGDQHMRVQKYSDKKQVSTALEQLNEPSKIDEIARMLGGIAITDNTRAHAEEMLATRH